MSPAGRPWWYSGDEDADAAAEPDNPGSEGAASGDPVSDDPISDDPASDNPSADDADSADSAPGIEWTVLLAGAQRVMDWATERVMAPHAEHDVPAEHPQCVVCRTMLLIGEGRGAAADDGPTGAPPSTTGQDPGDDAIDGAARARDRQIAWIPIRPGAGEP